MFARNYPDDYTAADEMAEYRAAVKADELERIFEAKYEEVEDGKHDQDFLEMLLELAGKEVIEKATNLLAMKLAHEEQDK